MPHYRSYDDAALSFRLLGPASSPLICLAGGPGRDAAYLGGLGGLDRSYRLVIPDARGTGNSPPSDDPDRYAFPALAQDLETLRAHLCLDRFALLAHGAASATAQVYAASYPERLSHLVLVCPEGRIQRAQGELPDDAREIFESRSSEPWWPDAAAAVRRLATASEPEEVRTLLAQAAPMAYARWDAPQRSHAAKKHSQNNPVPRAGFPQGVDDLARLSVLDNLREVLCPVLVVTGELDTITGVRVGQTVADSFPRGEWRRLSGVGHYPWVDDPDLFRASVTSFLGAL
ncbi:alpha/beta fold hydrolase [Streptomyces candidus]|uniref:Pimeloyl-ACP methyl ester carboxylesterase n=1 Tax=Streptomyces candidus TaxID=67283 RepID=A0A7X0HIP3_9ACTN|nr:alpha/beta hydrolase [Streptomyces candidus]MBB6436883.1 pimeloyl-ACP methyl ester carboxylesterase [Streptomyces candidus]GHH32121.1 hydrolase [Streptomyces candidus]